VQSDPHILAFLAGDLPFYAIAEIGSNHNGDLDLARRLIRAAADAGAHAVKFQSWQAPLLLNCMDEGKDGALTPSTVLPILERLEIPADWHPLLVAACRDCGVDFLSTPFDPARAGLLAEVGAAAIKIASGDLTYDQLLVAVAALGKPVILSTGMAEPDEIRRAVALLRDHGAPPVMLLHCIGAYPPEVGDANILVLDELRETFGLPVGFSDHYMSNEMAFAAFARGARVFEKHFTLSRDAGTPDAPFAMEPAHFRDLVDGLGRLSLALGDGRKRCMDSERDGRIGGRRSLFAGRDLAAGAVLTAADIAIVRPAIGDFAPADLEAVVGRPLARPVKRGQPLRQADFDGSGSGGNSAGA